PGFLSLVFVAGSSLPVGQTECKLGGHVTSDTICALHVTSPPCKIRAMNNNMVITRGIPASRKSTFARRWLAEDPASRIEVNRDNVRLMIGAGQIGDEAQERSVSVICDEMIHAGLRAGKSVVVSNTHLRLSDLLDAITIGLRYLPRGAITIQD